MGIPNGTVDIANLLSTYVPMKRKVWKSRRFPILDKIQTPKMVLAKTNHSLSTPTVNIHLTISSISFRHDLAVSATNSSDTSNPDKSGSTLSEVSKHKN